ncbi:MAG: 3-dehydroquinate synthase, partial [Planctomycetota bacterium]
MLNTLDASPSAETSSFIPDVPARGLVRLLRRFLWSFFDADEIAAPAEVTEDLLSRLQSVETLPPLASQLASQPAFAVGLGEGVRDVGSIAQLRQLRCFLSLPLGEALRCFATLARSLSPHTSVAWEKFAVSVWNSDYRHWKVYQLLEDGPLAERYREQRATLEKSTPHAVYPTSPYRESEGSVKASKNFDVVDAVMTLRVATTIKVLDDVLNPNDSTLAEVYAPLGRCVCLIDTNVDEHHGRRLERYCKSHGIALDKLVYRAMEVDKGIASVERMLGDFKRLGVARHEPVLVFGGGVLADTGGLACSLYHRGTPYVMLSSSLVAGVDAGPSPRTCCDGFGYKNLFGAYHPPTLAITDRTLFESLRPGWLRHGFAEIIKMATVKDAVLFEQLELGGP